MTYEQGYKILVPPPMVGVLISFVHLLGHKGLTRMLADLQSYSFPNKYSVVRRFIRCCYACFLLHKSSRKSRLGVYPTPSYPLEEVSVDLIESLNPSGGFLHILDGVCALTDFLILVPLKSKSASEVSHAFTYSVLQSFNLKRIHQDNALCFRSGPWLMMMAALGITVIGTSAVHPAGAV